MKKIFVFGILVALLVGCTKDQFSNMPPDIFVPSAFSPNGDGINDIFRPEMQDSVRQAITSYDLEIFSHEKQVVFYTDKPEEGWDGKNQQGKTLPAGEYSYLQRVQFTTDKVYNQFGIVSIYYP